MKIEVSQVTVGNNKFCVGLKHSDGSGRVEVFHFGDEQACYTALEICEKINELADDTDVEVVSGEIGNSSVLFLAEVDSNVCYAFYFRHDRDLDTAVEMANRYQALINNDDDDE